MQHFAADVEPFLCMRKCYGGEAWWYYHLAGWYPRNTPGCPHNDGRPKAPPPPPVSVGDVIDADIAARCTAACNAQVSENFGSISDPDEEFNLCYAGCLINAYASIY